MKKIILLALLFILPIGGSFAEEKAKAETIPDKLQETVIKFLDFTGSAGEKLVDVAETTGEWAKGEIPIIIKEYLNWHFAQSLIWFSIGVGFTVIAAILLYRNVVKKWHLPWKNDTDYGRSTDVGDRGFLSLIASVILLVLSGLIMGHNLAWVKISVAPRVYLIDEFKYLVK
jgi:hypothetical protein